MKKLISVLLASALLSSGACFAVDTSSGTDAAALSLDNIGQVWTDNSPEYLKINSDLKIAKASYDKLSDASDALSVAALLDSTGLYMYQASSVASSLGQAELNYDIAAAQYDQKIQNGILAAKQAMLTCRQDELNLGTLRSSLEQKQNQLNRYAEGVSKGYISQKVYDTLQSAVYDLQNSLTGLETKRDADFLTLKTKLGLRPDAELTFTWPDLSGDAFQALEMLDPGADLASMLSNSINLKVLQITYDSYSVPSHTYVTGAQLSGVKLSLETSETTAEAGYKTLYQSLMTQYADLQSSRRDLLDEKDKLDKLQGQYDLGYVSRLALDSLTLEYSSMAASVEVKECALYSAYLAYLNTVAGN